MNNLREAYEKFSHLLKGGRIDIEKAIEIESIQSYIINKLNIKYFNILLKYNLNEILDKLSESGELWELILETGEKMKIKVIDPKKAYSDFLVGDLEKDEAKVAFIAIQALARAKAQIEETKGLHEELTSYCPVCGAQSTTMIKRRKGYFMVCPFCGFTWKVSSDFACPFCGNKDKLNLGVFTGKRTRRLGLAWCQKCGRSWRIILDEKLVLSVPRLFLPVIAYGAEIYRPALDSVRSSTEELLSDNFDEEDLVSGERSSKSED